jgi:hypothetical protein
VLGVLGVVNILASFTLPIALIVLIESSEPVGEGGVISIRGLFTPAVALKESGNLQLMAAESGGSSIPALLEELSPIVDGKGILISAGL